MFAVFIDIDSINQIKKYFVSINFYKNLILKNNFKLE